jgi:hypothetical protein
MSVNLHQHVWLKIELDGTGRVGIFEGDFRSCMQQAFRFLMEPTTRLEKRGDNKEMLWTWRNSPFLAAAKDQESQLRLTSEVMAGLDLSDIQQLDEE